MTLRTTRIKVETDTFLVVRGAQATVAWCPDCAAEVDVLTLTALGKEPMIELERWTDAGKLHRWHSREGAIQICVDSLLHCLPYREARPCRSS